MNEGLVADVREIKDMLVEMKQLEAARKVREARIQTDVEKLDHAINGNDKPGLKTDVQIMQNKINGIIWLGGAVIVASIGNIMAIIFGR